MSDKETLKNVKFSKKWVVVLSNTGAEIHEGLLGRTITTLPFGDKMVADFMCRCVNTHDALMEQRANLLDALKQFQHWYYPDRDVANITGEMLVKMDKAIANATIAEVFKKK